MRRSVHQEIFTVPAPPNLITKRDVLNTDPQAYEEFPEDGQLYFVPHKSNYQDLYRSAELGCRCCVWLLAEEPHALLGRGNITSSCITQNPLDVFGFWVLRQDFGILHCILDFSRPSCLPHEPGTSSSILRFSTSHISDLRPTLAFEVVAAHDSPAAILNDVRGRPTAGPGELSHVKRWLDDCLSNHPKHIRTARRCGLAHGHNDNIEPTLPRRVLDLHWLGESQDLRLVDGSGNRGRYAALTYCWGPNPTKIFKTTSSTLANNTNRIAIHELNPLFQDAVQVCRSLDIPYLWIDALCIVQDDKDDWMNESKRMCDVYSNSFLTLSASMARSPNDRLWYTDTSQSPGLSGVPNILTIPYHQGGELYLYPRRPIKININARGTVSRRGWCLQERYLSRRILHFAKYCEWECLTTTQHETRDISIPYELSQPLPLVRPHGFEMHQGGLPEETRSLAGRPYSIWYALLEDYTGRNITYDGDLLPGILGLADLFARLTNDHLVCGLWSMDLVCGLMWEPRGLYKEEQQYPTCRPLERTASWSWLSTVGPKEWFSNFSQEDNAVQGVAVDQATLTIMLRTLVVPLPFRTRFEIEHFGTTWLPWSASWLDILEENEMAMEEGPPTLPRYFLLVFIKPRTIPRRRDGWGMVVRRTTHPDYCVRIGSAQIGYSDDKYRAVGPTCEEFWQKQEAQTVYIV